MKCTLVLRDEVNCRFDNIDADTRRILYKALEFEVPGARHLPSVKLGRWDGKTSLCAISGATYINLLDRVWSIVENRGYEIEIDDQRRPQPKYEFAEVTEDSYSHISWPECHQFAGEPIMIRDHQVEMINSYLKNPQCINIIPTSGGKTIITGILSHKVQEYGRSIVIVPSKDLVTQTAQDYRNMGLDVGVYFGDKKELNKTHTICTWQSLDVLKKKSKEYGYDGITLEDFLEGVVCVIADEVHRVTGNVLREMLTSGDFAHIPIRWGLTGTMPETKLDQCIVLSCIGPQINEIVTKDLQDKGILAKLDINIWQMQDIGDVFGSYQEELKWLTTDEKRIAYLATKIIDISTSGNTLVLVDRVETGKMFEKLIPDSVFVHGELKSADRKKEYDEVMTVDNKVIIATYGVASTGTNIPRLFNLVLFEPGKAFVRVVQSIGRGLRTTKDKDYVAVYDITSNCKYSKRHSLRRREFYKERQYPYKLTKVKYI